MSRTPATIVIPVWNQWELTRACLESLRPTLGVRDQVVIVDNGSEDGTATGLRQYSWATVITNEVNRGFAVACNQGAAAALRDVVVFLNNDTLVPGHWLDGLLEPFEDASVGATGPRSNMVSGPQLIEPHLVTYGTGRMAELRRFAKEWRMAHRRQVSDVERLVGFCLAVRTDAFRAVGGFDEGFEIGGFEDDDLCRRLRAEGWRLLITHESFVHHHGHATFEGNGLDWLAVQNANQDRFMEKHTGRRPGQPLLSAALIVKDEEKFLGACLDSLDGLVDEVVVYDTGSTDGTVAIAEAHGATVIQGYWDDDFGRARNAALEHCRGEWILSIDADEVVEGDRSRLRHNLGLAVDFDVCMVEIENLGGTEDDNHVAVAHRMSRLFRRDRAEWRHRLHEQLVPRGNGPDLRGGVVEEIKLVHYGYLTETMTGRNKLERNIRIAQTDVDDTAGGSSDEPLLLLNLARSLVLGGRVEEAIERFRQIRAAEDAMDSVRRAALRHGAEALLNLGRPEEALEWAEELAEISEDKGLARYLEGTARLLLGQHAAAAELLDGVESLTVEEGIAFSTSPLQVRRGFARAALGDWDGAATAFTAAAEDASLIEPIWAPMIEAYHRTERDMAAIAALVPPTRLTEVAGQTLCAPPEAADGFADELWQRASSDARVIALAIRLAPQLAPERTLEWSARLRAAGFAERCPLVAAAGDSERAGADRVLAAALAHAAFGDERGAAALEPAAAMVTEDTMQATLVQLGELAPDLLPRFIEGAVTDGPRAEAVADALAELGAAEQAAAVRDYGRERFGAAAR